MKLKLLLLSALLLLSLNVFAQNTSNCNCCSTAHQDFDFWIGEWETYNPDGTLAGTNSIDKIQGNCILRENWTSATAGYTGTSYNFYNYQLKQWEQIWVDNQGQSLHLKGNRVGNQMIMKTEVMKDRKGNDIYNKVTWTKNEDGTVRQVWETSPNQKEWTIVFDGLYKKKGKQ